MANTLRIDNTAPSNMTGSVPNLTVNALNTDGASGQEETEWINTKWSQYWGYFNEVADLKSTILMKAIWNVGRGFNCDAYTRVILTHVIGSGKSSFEDILFNMEVTRRIGGDAFAEIIWGDDDILLNLKPLDPGSIKIIVDKKGAIKRYEQITKTDKSIVKFQPEDIFHLSNNQLADQIHGISDIEGMEPTILAEKERFNDTRRIMHTQARPMIVWKLGTDDTTKIAAFIAKMDAALAKGENIYIPEDETAVSFEVVQSNPSPMVLEWGADIRKKFHRSIIVPELLSDTSGSSESGGKIGSLHWSQVVENDQRYIERQVKEQLGLEIDLLPPETITSELQTDQSKDGNNAFQPSDMIAGVGR